MLKVVFLFFMVVVIAWAAEEVAKTEEPVQDGSDLDSSATAQFGWGGPRWGRRWGGYGGYGGWGGYGGGWGGYGGGWGGYGGGWGWRRPYGYYGYY